MDEIHFCWHYAHVMTKLGWAHGLYVHVFLYDVPVFSGFQGWRSGFPGCLHDYFTAFVQ